MVFLKTEEEIERIQRSSKIVSETLAQVAKHIQPGLTLLELDRVAETFIKKSGGQSGFLGYDGYPNTLCISINDEVIHGIPSSRKIQDGDMVSCDCGVLLDGFYGDACYTFLVGEVTEEHKRLCQVTKEALYKGIEVAIEGNRIGRIGHAIQSHVEQNGFSVVREYCGHGIGKNLHEDPLVRNYGNIQNGIQLKSGMLLAIEPMVCSGKGDVKILPDGWTVKTRDQSLACHFEQTIVVRESKAQILTDFKVIETQIFKNSYLWQNSLLLNKTERL